MELGILGVSEPSSNVGAVDAKTEQWYVCPLCPFPLAVASAHNACCTTLGAMRERYVA